MRENFPDIVDYEFTASMEDKLDSIENKENTIYGVLSGFYEDFKKSLDTALSASHVAPIMKSAAESDVICERCGARMVYKTGRFGNFLACPSYPQCKNTKAVDKNGKVVEPTAPKVEFAGFKCDSCGGEMVIRKGKFGTFYACQNYPTCKFTKQKIQDTGASCPKCQKRVLARHGKGNTLFYSCENYPKCDFSSWDMPLSEKCPECGEMLYYRKSKKSVICKKRSCGYKREEEMSVIE
jgi:DNA topoisomerase-1